MARRLARPIIVCAAVLASVGLGAPFAYGQSDASVEERLRRVETMLNSGTLIELLQRVEGLQAELQALRGEVEEQTHAISQLKKRQRELYLDMDRRVSKIETAGVQPAATTTNGDALNTEGTTEAIDTTAAVTPPAGTTSSDGIDPIKEQDAYQNAFNLLKSGRYPEAGTAFEAFLNEYGTGKYADNAQYWLGETFYVRQQFEQAVQQFRILTEKYPNSAKFPHALLKIGYSQAEMGQDAEAEKTFGELIAKFPQTAAARNAQKRLNLMQGATS